LLTVIDNSFFSCQFPLLASTVSSYYVISLQSDKRTQRTLSVCLLTQCAMKTVISKNSKVLANCTYEQLKTLFLSTSSQTYVITIIVGNIM